MHARSTRLAVVVAVVLLQACGSAKVEDGPSAVRLAVAPERVTLVPGGQQQFAAAVSGTDDRAVTWSVQERTGGSIDGSGLYRAPAVEGTFHVRALSGADGRAIALAEVTVKRAAGPVDPGGQTVEVTITPRTAAVVVGGTQQFAAAVGGTSNTAVTWSVAEPAGGTVSADGLYRAPAAAGLFHVVATSQADPSRSATAAVSVAEPGTSLWVSAYYGEWQHQRYPVANIDWSAMTHAIMHRVGPRAPGATSAGNPYATISSDFVLGNGGPAAIRDFADRAHAHGVKAILGFGGSNDAGGWAGAASDANRARFAADILAALDDWHYDGVDIDWEPLDTTVDGPKVLALSKALKAARPGILITVPAGSVNSNFGINPTEGSFWKGLEPYVDQISPMTYCGTGAWDGWKVWHFNPLFGHGPDHPVDVAFTMEAWAGLGIPKHKLGLGIGFYGMAVAPPVTGVLQDYNGARMYSDDNWMNYGNIVRHFVGKAGAARQWDPVAKVPFLSFAAPFQPVQTWNEQYGANDPGPTVQFVSYEDAESILEKGRWARENGFGGAIVWTVNEGTTWYPGGGWGVDGYANPLMDAVKSAFLGASAPVTPPDAGGVDAGVDGGAPAPDAGSAAPDAGLPPSDLRGQLEVLGGKKLFFGHQSVGGQIMGPDGVRRLIAENPGVALRVTELGDPFTTGAWAQGGVGSNGDPLSKIASFDSIVRGSAIPGADVAFMKLGCVDFQTWNHVDPIATFDRYRATLDQLKADFPSTTFVHVTVSVVGGDCDGNALREAFSTRMRDTYRDAPVFDLATVLSTRPDGSRCTSICGPGTFPELCSDWNIGDGVHLNPAGSRMAAEKLVGFLAGLP